MLFHKIRYLLAEILGTDESEVNRSTLLNKEYGIDEIDFAHLIIKIEELYYIEIPDDEAAMLNSVGDIVDYVYTRINTIWTPSL